MRLRIEVNVRGLIESAVSISLSLASLTVTDDFVISFLEFLKNDNLVIYETLEEINETNPKLLVYEDYHLLDDNNTTLRALMKKFQTVSGSFEDFKIFAEPFIAVFRITGAHIVASTLKLVFSCVTQGYARSIITLSTAGKVLALEKNSP